MPQPLLHVGYFRDLERVIDPADGTLHFELTCTSVDRTPLRLRIPYDDAAALLDLLKRNVTK
jgi:hypothetical protein